MQLLKRKQNHIVLHVVDIKEAKIKIPVAKLGSGEGKTILITAGLDGDEYAGIAAAYGLINQYAKEKIAGKLIIIPLVNVAGFEHAMSRNPFDKKYPKHIFPGKEKGSSSERLMYWLSSNFVKNADIWIDLHGGAPCECLDPFVCLFETKQKNVQAQTYKMLGKIKAERIIFEKQNTFAHNVGKRKTAYIMLESGQCGQRRKEDIKRHITWVKQIVEEKRQGKPIKKKIYRKEIEVLAQKDGIWVPLFFGKNVKKKTVLGEVISLDAKILQKIIAKENGVFLWRREAMACQKNDSLYAYGSQKETVMA